MFSDHPTDLSIALEAAELGKCYPIYKHPRDRLLQALRGNRKPLYRPFWALENVSFSLERGRTLGVVGRNGSGKSTLLQLICGTLTPTKGSVSVRGRIAALLELGSGFNPEFSGLENIYLNGSLLGLTQEFINARLDDILAFADIGEFVNQPVKTYSSGMAVRLAFAVQAHVQPDLLVVDEALAVGDEMFQKKCYAHLEKLKAEGTAILLVTHSCPQILQHCDEALLLHKGHLRAIGHPKTITTTYQRLCNAPAEQWDYILKKIENNQDEPKQLHLTTTLPSPSSSDNHFDPHLIPTSAVSYEAHGIQIDNVQILNGELKPANIIPMGEAFSVRFSCNAEASLSDLQMACNIANHTGVRITGQVHQAPNCDSGSKFNLTFHFEGKLLPGLYFIGGGIWRRQEPGRFLHRVVDQCALRITASTPPSSFGLCDLQASKPTLEHEGKPC